MLKCVTGTVDDVVWDSLTSEERSHYGRGVLRARDAHELVGLLNAYGFIDTMSPYAVLVLTEAPIEVERSDDVQVVYATKED